MSTTVNESTATDVSAMDFDSLISEAEFTPYVRFYRVNAKLTVMQDGTKFLPPQFVNSYEEAKPIIANAVAEKNLDYVFVTERMVIEADGTERERGTMYRASTGKWERKADRLIKPQAKDANPFANANRTNEPETPDNSLTVSL